RQIGDDEATLRIGFLERGGEFLAKLARNAKAEAGAVRRGMLMVHGSLQLPWADARAAGERARHTLACTDGFENRDHAVHLGEVPVAGDTAWPAFVRSMANLDDVVGGHHIDRCASRSQDSLRAFRILPRQVSSDLRREMI